VPATFCPARIAEDTFDDNVDIENSISIRKPTSLRRSRRWLAPFSKFDLTVYLRKEGVLSAKIIAAA
jgi:hypothetical protein